MALAAVPRSSPLPVATTDDLLRELIAEVRGLREDLRAGRAAPSLSRTDRVLVGKLLAPIAGVFGSEPFTSAEVVEHKSDALRVVCGGLSARQLGPLLRRATNVPIGGLVVTCLGTEAGAVLWQIFEVPEFPGNKNLSVPHATPRGRL
jgi:hypothetical protein